MDGLTGIKEPKKVKVAKEDDNVTEGEEQPQVIGRRTVIQLYADRMTLPCQNEQLIAALPQMNLLRFSSEVDMQGKEGLKRVGPRGQGKPRVMNLKPYLQLDVTAPGAAKHAKMALRMLAALAGCGPGPHAPRR